MALKIEYIAIVDLREYGKNARTHSEEQVAQIAASMEEFGFTNPVLVDEENEIIAGHGRLAAATQIGLEEIPAIRLVGLSDEQKRALRIADNTLALNAGWDLDLLAEEVQGLNLDGFELDLLGFDDDYMDALLDGDIDALLNFENHSESENEDQDGEEEQSVYTSKISVPIYEPKGTKPDIGDLFDDEKSRQLLDKIKTSEIPQEIKEFLILAAYRHVRVNYQNVAEFYAHTKDEEIRKLFRDSALVIIDYDEAIENGYVQLTKKLMELSDKNQEEGHDNEE